MISRNLLWIRQYVRVPVQEDSPPDPTTVLPIGSDTEMSPNTIDSSLVTVIPREDFLPSNIDSLDDVSSLPHDAPEVSSEPSSSLVLPDPSPFLKYVKQDSLVLLGLFYAGEREVLNSLCILLC